MFESSLIDLEAKQHPRRRWAPLPIAIALHGIVLASVGLAQVWNVEAVGDPEVVTPFHVSLVPSLQAAPATEQPAKQTATASKPVAPSKPVQPDLREVPDLPTTPSVPEISTGPSVADSSRSGGPSNGGPDDGTSLLDGPVSHEADTASVVPVAAPLKDEILTVGGAVTRPALLSGSAPRYPKIAQHARIEGRVILQAVIDERGRVTDVRVLQGLPMGLDQAAVETVRNWTFEPAKLQGRAVKVYYTLTVDFRLKG
ncbi:MAG TPA: energy transducer TonB [Thermoanaerobaculia bacterium]|nr:energy transducer TonB [Thermoanaerobaculia bacterium]